MPSSVLNWDPTSFFIREGSVVPYGVVILNQPLNVQAFDAIKARASLVVCADGGANRLYESSIEQQLYPDYVGVTRPHAYGL